MISDEPTVQVADPFLRRLIEEIDALMLDARALTDSLTPAQLNWKPDARKWSIAQCLDHLTRSARLYPVEIERMITESRERAADSRPFREGWIARWVVAGMEPPPRLRIRTSRKAEPSPEPDPETVVREFEKEHLRLRHLTAAADGVSLRHARMRSPFARFVRFTLGQILALNPAHARRHLWQAWQIRQHPKFPG